MGNRREMRYFIVKGAIEIEWCFQTENSLGALALARKKAQETVAGELRIHSIAEAKEIKMVPKGQE